MAAFAVKAAGTEFAAASPLDYSQGMAEPYPMRKYVVPELVFGEGASLLAGRYARSFDASRVFVVTDPGIQTAGWTDAVIHSLEQEGLEAVVYSDIHPNPRVREVEAGVRSFLEARCDALVAIGGGSPMDAAKGIAAAAANEADVRSFEGIDRIPIPTAPMICVPTTAGTGSEVSRFAIINDEKRGVKFAIVSPKVVPDVALIDPRLLATMPANLAAATGMDALTHAVEAYVSTAASALTDLDARAAVRLVNAHVEELHEHPGDAAAQGAMALASLLAGRAFSNAGLGVVHAMAHALGGLLDASHGLCNALLLDGGILANGPSARDRYAELAEDLGASGEELAARDPVEVLAGRVRSLRRRLGLDRSLRDLGVTKDDLPRLARFAHRDACLNTNPRRLDVADIQRIYEQAL